MTDLFSFVITNSFRDKVIACEGAYETYPMEPDPFDPSLRFGKADILNTDIKMLEKIEVGIEYNS